jgi:hypothetical protein
MIKSQSKKGHLREIMNNQARDEGLDLEMTKETITTTLKNIEIDKDREKDLLILGVIEAIGETDLETGKIEIAKGAKEVIETEITGRLKVVPRGQVEEDDKARLFIIKLIQFNFKELLYNCVL